MNFVAYPLLFKPSFSKRVWGGNKIHNVLKRKNSKDNSTNIAESLEIFDRNNHSSKIINGIYAQRTLNSLVKEFTKKLVSPKHSSLQSFPIIIKYLNPTTPTSVQVHPNKAFIQKYGGQEKSEFWYILEADKSAKAFIGLQKGINKDTFLKKVHSEEILNCLQNFSLKAGDTYNILQGQIHCLTGETLALEIQDNSECTYRFYDWNRQRKLHIKEAILATNFSNKTSSSNIYNATCLSNKNSRSNLSSLCSNFIIDTISLIDVYHHSTEESCEILIPLSNDIELVHNDIRYSILRYSPILLPYALGRYSLISKEKTQIISIKLK